MKPAAVAICIATVILACFTGGCASADKPRHPSDRKWYQGEMDNQERSFFLDTFFKGNSM